MRPFAYERAADARAARWPAAAATSPAAPTSWT